MVRDMALPVIEYRAATISPCGRYRYDLERRWDGAGPESPYVAWCGLNPSKADGKRDDPTARRMIGFTHAWGYRRMIIVNLYAYRATKPRDLQGLTLEELQGPENEEWLSYWMVRARGFKTIVFAWGGNRFDCVPLPPVLTCVPSYCLSRTKGGEPGHPLYLPANSQLIRIN